MNAPNIRVCLPAEIFEDDGLRNFLVEKMVTIDEDGERMMPFVIDIHDFATTIESREIAVSLVNSLIEVFDLVLWKTSEDLLVAVG